MAGNSRKVVKNECDNIYKVKKSLKKPWLFIGGLLILVLIGYGVFHFIGSMGAKASKTVSVDGIVLTDNNSPENKILFGDDIHAAERNWQDYSDTEQEKAQINKRINSLQNAFKSKNVNQITGFFNKAEKNEYKRIFTENKKELSVFYDIFSNMEMVYLSPPVNPKTDSFTRIAEYKAYWNDMEFSIVFIKEDGKWYILDL